MVKPEILQILEQEAARNGQDFTPYRQMLLSLPKEDQPSYTPTDLESSPELQTKNYGGRRLQPVHADLGQTSRPATNGKRSTEWECSGCSESFKELSDLLVHLVKEHVKFFSKQRPRTNASAIRCPQCPNTYLDGVDSLLHHYDTTHGTRFRLFMDVRTKEQMEKLIVRVNKKHINVVRSAYGEGIFATRYKYMCDEFDKVKENSDLILLKEEGSALSAIVTNFVDMTVPGKKTEFEAPNSCPLCAKVMTSEEDFKTHLEVHDKNAHIKWKRTKLDMLKQEVDWKVLFRQKQKDLIRERYCTVSTTIQEKRAMADRETECRTGSKGYMNMSPSSSSPSPTSISEADVGEVVPDSPDPASALVKFQMTDGKSDTREGLLKLLKGPTDGPESRGGPKLGKGTPILNDTMPEVGMTSRPDQILHSAPILITRAPVTMHSPQIVEQTLQFPTEEFKSKFSEVVNDAKSGQSSLNMTVADLARKMKRRDLVATNRNARPKPLTAQKILSLSCMQCGLVFENRCKFTRHQLDHKNEANPYRCSIKSCLLSYDNRAKLRSHFLRKHPELDDLAIDAACQRGDMALAAKGKPIINDIASFIQKSGVRASQDVTEMLGDSHVKTEHEDGPSALVRDPLISSITEGAQLKFVDGQLILHDPKMMFGARIAAVAEQELQKVKVEPSDELEASDLITQHQQLRSVPPATHSGEKEFVLFKEPEEVKPELNDSKEVPTIMEIPKEEPTTPTRPLRKRKARTAFSP